MAASGPFRVTKRVDTGAVRRSRCLLTESQRRSLVQEGGSVSGLPSPQSEAHQQREGKRKCQAEEDQDTGHEVPVTKRRRSVAGNHQCNSDTPVVPHDDLVQAWVYNDSEWVRDLRETRAMSDGNPRPPKRSLSSTSSVGRTTSSGRSRGWWENRHAEQMHDGGLIMEEREGIACTQQCQELCERLLECEDSSPNDWYLKEPGCRKVLRDASFKNERRVERDVPPIICPSSELLTARGYEGLEHIKEGLDAEWTACTNLFGPKPKPDGSYGISRHVFTKEENEKLSFSTTAECEGSIFQFIIRQAKRSDGSLLQAERQAMHNASVACNTVIELYESIGAVEELDRRILAFSMSHNHATVRIFAHFAVISTGNKTFHRQLLYETDLLSLSSDLCKPYKITLGIFRLFYPQHLRRIKDALARRPDHSIGSFTAQLSIDKDRQEDISTAPSSREGGHSKKTSLASTVMLREENERVRTQMLGLIQVQREQAEQQRVESSEQRVLLELQLEEHRQQREQMQEDARQQREQMQEDARQQREELRQQIAQQQTIIDLLQGKK